MGIVCDTSEIDKIIKSYNDFIIISCVSLDIIKGIFKEFDILSLGEILSYKLFKIDKSNRNLEVETTLKQILSDIDKSHLIITDIDILFNPAYRLDIIKLFIQLSRNKKIIVQWSGKFDSQNLVYSSPEYEDYKKYSIKDYDIICLR